MEQNKPTDRRVIRTKRAIKNALARLLLEKNINDITVSDIAVLADINRKTFYNYYAGLYEVMDEIENDLISRFDALLTEPDFENNANNPCKIFEKLTAIINKDSEFFSYLMGMDANASLSIKLGEMLKAKAKAILLKYLAVEESKLDLMLEFMVTGSVAVYRRWYNSDRREPLEEVSKKINLLIFQGIKGYLNIDIDAV